MIFIKLLFVCSRNKWRSLTAETIYKDLNGYNVKSVGTEKNARIKITGGHIGWADIILVMEKKHLRRLKEKYKSELDEKNIICLNIADDYKYMDEDLIDLLNSKVSEYIEI